MNRAERVREDYRKWRALGEGGLPANIAGYGVTSALRLFKREPLSTLAYGPRPRFLPEDLPARSGFRPGIGHHPIPHRQLNQHADAVMVNAARSLARRLRDEMPDRFSLERSHYEKRGEAVFVKELGTLPVWIPPRHPEIGHVHAGDGSMHVILSDPDAATTISAGWGERHPLAGVRAFGLPRTYLLIYAPRDETELEVCRQILVAAAGLRSQSDRDTNTSPA